jgi:hypothetical protein
VSIEWHKHRCQQCGAPTACGGTWGERQPRRHLHSICERRDESSFPVVMGASSSGRWPSGGVSLMGIEVALRDSQRAAGRGVRRAKRLADARRRRREPAVGFSRGSGLVRRVCFGVAGGAAAPRVSRWLGGPRWRSQERN